MIDEEALCQRYLDLKDILDERARRLWAAAEAKSAGRGAFSAVDKKKKELVGDFKNGGREWQPKGQPQEVRVHDFMDQELGKAVPHGVYDVGSNVGWVSLGVTHDTAEFVAATTRRWWRRMNLLPHPFHGDWIYTIRPD